MNNFTFVQIEMKLSKLLESDHIDWIQVGMILSAVKATRYWSKGFSSFSKWLEAWGKEIGLGKATLWRYITAQQKYNQLRKGALECNYHFPAIDEIKCPISPEGIEIFHKLSRVLEEHEIYEMVEGFIEGQITRKELRDKWNIYKPVLAGKTARGLPESSILKVDPLNKRQQGFILESIVMDGLRVSGSAWIRDSKSHKKIDSTNASEAAFFKFFQNVRVAKQEKETLFLDVVLAVKESEQAPLHIHGVEIVGGELNKNKGKGVAVLRKHCNAFWIAMSEEYAEKSLKFIPEGIGLITVKNKKVKVLIRAQIDDLPELLVETLKVLLTRWKSS